MRVWWNRYTPILINNCRNNVICLRLCSIMLQNQSFWAFWSNFSPFFFNISPWLGIFDLISLSVWFCSSVDDIMFVYTSTCLSVLIRKHKTCWGRNKRNIVMNPKLTAFYLHFYYPGQAKTLFEQCICRVYVYPSCVCLDFVPSDWSLNTHCFPAEWSAAATLLWFFIFTPVSVRPFPVSTSTLDAEMGINCSTSPKTIDCLYDTARYAKRQQPEHLSLVVSLNVSFCDLGELNLKMSSSLLSENSLM